MDNAAFLAAAAALMSSDHGFPVGTGLAPVLCPLVNVTVSVLARCVAGWCVRISHQCFIVLGGWGELLLCSTQHGQGSGQRHLRKDHSWCFSRSLSGDHDTATLTCWASDLTFHSLKTHGNHFKFKPQSKLGIGFSNIAVHLRCIKTCRVWVTEPLI